MDGSMVTYWLVHGEALNHPALNQPTMVGYWLPTVSLGKPVEQRLVKLVVRSPVPQFQQFETLPFHAIRQVTDPRQQPRGVATAAARGTTRHGAGAVVPW